MNDLTTPAGVLAWAATDADDDNYNAFRIARAIRLLNYVNTLHFPNYPALGDNWTTAQKRMLEDLHAAMEETNE